MCTFYVRTAQVCDVCVCVCEWPIFTWHPATHSILYMGYALTLCTVPTSVWTYLCECVSVWVWSALSFSIECVSFSHSLQLSFHSLIPYNAAVLALHVALEGSYDYIYVYFVIAAYKNRISAIVYWTHTHTQTNGHTETHTNTHTQICPSVKCIKHF